MLQNTGSKKLNIPKYFFKNWHELIKIWIENRIKETQQYFVLHASNSLFSPFEYKGVQTDKYSSTWSDSYHNMKNCILSYII